MAYRLRMSGEIHDWLADLHHTDPPAALLVGQALAALISEGASLGPPLVVPVAETWPEDLAAALDASYQHRLERLQVVRKRATEAASLVRDIQDQVDELESARARLDERWRRALDGGRKDEAERAGRQRAAAERDITQARQLLPWISETEAWLRTRLERLQRRTDDFRVRKELLKASYIAARAEIQVAEEIPAAPDPEAAGRLRDLTAEIRQELGRQPLPDGLLEARAGDAPEASAHAYNYLRSLPEEFFPGQAAELADGAAALAARNRAHTLAGERTRLGLTQTEVAYRMAVPQDQVAAIERADPGTTDVRTLAAYIEALGGRLELIAEFGGDRIVLH